MQVVNGGLAACRIRKLTQDKTSKYTTQVQRTSGATTPYCVAKSEVLAGDGTSTPPSRILSAWYGAKDRARRTIFNARCTVVVGIHEECYCLVGEELEQTKTRPPNCFCGSSVDEAVVS